MFYGYEALDSVAADVTNVFCFVESLNGVVVVKYTKSWSPTSEEMSSPATVMNRLNGALMLIGLSNPKV